LPVRRAAVGKPLGEKGGADRIRWEGKKEGLLPQKDVTEKAGEGKRMTAIGERGGSVKKILVYSLAVEGGLKGGGGGPHYLPYIRYTAQEKA